MSGYSVKLNKTKLLEQNNSLLTREVELLRTRLARAEDALLVKEGEEAAAEECCDIKALEKQREFIEYRSNKELKANSRIQDPQLEHRFLCAGKTSLLCLLQSLQLWKVKLAEAELASLISEIWDCKTQNSEDSLGAIVERINCELENCPDDLDPFVADAINEVMRDC